MNLRQAILNSKVNYADSWKHIKRKRFAGVDRFHSPDLVYLQQARAFANFPDVTERPEPMESFAFVAAVQLEFDSPIFFVSPQLLDAVLQTTLPDRLEWQTMRLPFEAASFVLPKHCNLRDEKGVEVGHLDYCRIAGSLQEKAGWDEPEFMTSVVNINGEGLLEGIAGEVQSTEKWGSIYRIVFNILFAMAARPEYIENGRKIGKHKKSGSEIWTPNILGRKYATKRTATDGTHASPRMHWRRGHFRHHAIGAGRTDHKVIWIEPVMVGLKALTAKA